MSQSSKKQEEQQPSTELQSYDKAMQDMVASIHNTISSPERAFLKTRGKTFTFPDGHSEDEFDGVIVSYVSTNTYYKDRYDPNNIVPPTCFAIGENPATLVPSENAPERQASSCAECPLNQWGSDGKGKACKNGRLLAILPPDATENTDPVFLRVPPTSLKNFDGYVSKIAATLKKPPIGVVTKIKVDKESEYLKLHFEPQGVNQNVGVAMERMAEVKDLLVQEPDLSVAA